MPARKSLPGPGNPVFYFWSPNFSSDLIDHPNVVSLAFINVAKPNQWRPAGIPRMTPDMFGGPDEYNTFLDDDEPWNRWRLAIHDLESPHWENCVKTHLRACVQTVANIFEHCGYIKGTGSRGGGNYESGVSLNNFGIFRNSKASDSQWHDIARLYAHPLDAASEDDPDDMMTLLHNGQLLLPAAESSPNLGELKANRYTPWCENGIAEVAPLTLYFAEQLKAELDARNLCYPAELVMDNEQSPIGWILANLDAGVQVGNFNNVHQDERAGANTVYEIRDELGRFVPVTYNDHFAAQDLAEGGELADSLVGGRYDGYYSHPPIHRMLWRLYTFAYDYVEHKAYYEPWKKVFPASKCGNYGGRYVPVEDENPLLINYDDNVRVYSEHLRADISSPVLYPNVIHPGYGGHESHYDSYVADARDIVEQCNKFDREFRAWIRIPTLPGQVVSTLTWDPDRFARFVAEMGEVGGHGFYVFNDPGWNAGSDDLVKDAVTRALIYSNRSARELDLINIGGGKRR